ncbi:phosphatase PAP2 family protein [Limosilactobacillus sp. STM2_1]|uniref:Phosphatase PAP2 family protein n=1 Tax=Limosilactobacillus rudii TaxID=2759755 RepID=A0A7W3UMC0_9LACO|nr:phosphatase PAP2 family protein [Limosilactobacillus rudii]MBB1078915.1 phosphatase PAP2 family protein [Limosilactobacillus rudii]MBB1098209.1 phosphatase PAP2 family protein [Limosilactobacillus rudii]MCD7135676.1 phosphatase PAP2 family protein [Limosilactobacillus rudii]
MHNKLKVTIGLFCWLLFGLVLVNIVEKVQLIRLIDRWGWDITRPTTSFKTFALTELTFLGDPVTVGIITIGLMLFLWRRKQATDSVWYGMLQFLGYCLVILVKYSVIRLRPVHRLITVSGYSFPSGHTFSTTILVFTLLAIIIPHLKRQWVKALYIIVSILWILLIMYSRVYLRAHFTSDVIGGFLLATGWWLLINTQRHRFFDWLTKPVNR